MSIMTYENFKEKVAKEFLNFMPEEYRNATIKIQPVNKTNIILDGLTVVPNNAERNAALPTIYINDIYEVYAQNKNFDNVISHFATTYTEYYQKRASFTQKIDLSDTSRIIFQLINTQENQGLLESVPHREFWDLSLIYRYLVDINEDNCSSFIIHDNIAEGMKLSEAELFELASKNTSNLLPATIRTMDEVLRELLKVDGMPQEMIELVVSTTPNDFPMYVISNIIKINGACSMLYDELLHNLATELDSDLYIMPSSIHECIIIKVTNDQTPEELAEMVADINGSEVDVEERLSNQVYYYDKNSKKISLATNNKNSLC